MDRPRALVLLCLAANAGHLGCFRVGAFIGALAGQLLILSFTALPEFRGNLKGLLLAELSLEVDDAAAHGLDDSLSARRRP
jgi:hypothetical protein